MRIKRFLAQGRVRIAAMALVAVVPALAFGLYMWSGDSDAAGAEPGTVAGPAMEISALKEDESARFYSDLERHLRFQPSDVRAWVFKARLDMNARRYEQAAAGFANAVAGKSKAANDPGVWVEYAEARGMAQGRTLIGEPQKLVEKALAIDPNHAAALDLAGSAAWEMKDFALAAVHWKRLLEQLPPDTARHSELQLAIERAQQRAKISLPSSTR